MRFSAPSFLVGLLALAIGADARSSTGDRVLLVVDKEDRGQFKGDGTYTKFLDSLKSESNSGRDELVLTACSFLELLTLRSHLCL